MFVFGALVSLSLKMEEAVVVAAALPLVTLEEEVVVA
jgi:hypothetical protein